jgi:hypothetical protein
MRSRTAAWVVRLAAAGALASAGCKSPAQTWPEPSSVAASASHRPTLPPVMASRTPGYELGKRYLYGLKTSTAVRFAGAATDFDYDLSAALELVPTAVTSAEVTLHATLRDLRIQNKVSGRSAELDALAVELSTSSAAFTLTGGRASEFRAPPALGVIAAGTYRQIAAALQFVHAEGGALRYSAEEHDTTGRYLVDYELAADRKGWRKQKRRYLALLGDSSDERAESRIVPEVVRSLAEVTLHPSGRPSSVKLADEVAIRGGQIPVRSMVTVGLEFLREASTAEVPQLAQETTGYRRYAADEPILGPQSNEALDDARIGDLTFDEVVRRIEQLASERKPVAVADRDPATGSQPDPEEQVERKASIQEDARLFSALTALLRKHPENIGLAVAAVRRKSPAAETLLDTLGSASTKEAHSALAGLLRTSDVNPELRERLVLVLARVRKPSKEATFALRVLLDGDPFHAGALYGLGTHARLLRDEGRLEEARELGEFLVDRLKLANGPASLGTVLKAIANSGYDGALPRVLPYLHDDREEVRKAAVRSLQSMRTSDVDLLIAERLETDVSKDVKLSALAAARLRKPGSVLEKALVATGAPGQEPHVRYRAVELMARWLPDRPELRETLKRIAKDDVEARIRERALAAL